MAPAFTQKGVSVNFVDADGIPMGHEWLTRMAAFELLAPSLVEPDAADPRNEWSAARKAQNPSLESAVAQAEVKRILAESMQTEEAYFRSTYQVVYSAIIGERWVDIGGFNVLKSMAGAKILGGIDGFSVVAQEAAELQVDHFMRSHFDEGPRGGVTAARRAQERFVTHFVNAAMAPQLQVRVWDGGGVREEADVDLNYFLFGRAVHLFQDAFSSEHVVRIEEDDYRSVRQVLSYLCALGCEQHTHDPQDIRSGKSGDVVWLEGTSYGWEHYKPSNMKTVALVAAEASKDLWAAFIRTMATPMAERNVVATAEANQLVENWLSFDEAVVLNWYKDPNNRKKSYVRMEGESASEGSVTQQEAMAQLGFSGLKQKLRAQQIEDQRRECVYSIVPRHGYEDLYDPYLRIPYFWEWADQALETLPDALPEVTPNKGTRVRFKNAATGEYLSAPDGLENHSRLSGKAGGEPLEFIMVGEKARCTFRTAEHAGLFLSYRELGGPVKLYHSPFRADFKVEKVGDHWTVYNLARDQYFWMDGDEPYVSRKGKADSAEAQWILEGLK